MTRPLLIAFGFVAAAFAVGAWAYLRLPADAQIAVHFAANGHPNGFAPKARGLFIIPTVMALVTLSLAYAPRIMPNAKSMTSWQGAYGVVIASVAGVLFAAEAAVVARALDPAFDVLRAVYLATGVMLVIVGNLLGKIRQNWLLGIRTPWTLSNARVWDKTHRFAGRLMFAAGLVLVATSAFVANERFLLALMIASAAGPVLVAAAYSYFVYRALKATV